MGNFILITELFKLNYLLYLLYFNVVFYLILPIIIDYKHFNELSKKTNKVKKTSSQRFAWMTSGQEKKIQRLIITKVTLNNN